MLENFSFKDFSERKQVGIWVRVSTDLKSQEESPAHHEQRARYYAESKGWVVGAVYSLEGMSGKSVSDYPQTKQMKSDIETGKITGLIFSKLARLARNTRELLDFSDFFQKHSADMISLDDSIDTSTPSGRMFYTFQAAQAQWEREEISARVRASVPVRARMGKPLGGAAPFGYRWENRTLVPDPKETPVRRLIYELFLKHGRRKTVADLLNKAGHRTRGGSLFTDTTVTRLIEDPSAKGIRRANYTRSRGAKKHWDLKPREEWVEIPIEAIVETSVWEEANALLRSIRHSRRKPARRAVQLFAGIAFCHCGGKMKVPSNNRKYICPDCHNKISTLDLEEIYHHQLKGFVFSPQEIIGYLQAADETLRDKKALLETLKRKQAGIQSEMKKIYRLYMDDKISADGFGDTYRPLENQLAEITGQIPELQCEADFLKIQYLSSDDIISEFQSLYEKWKTLETSDKRMIVEHTVERITVGEGEISIELGFIPSSSELMATRQRSNTDSSKRPM
jgi:site-specific DNA recombinase